MGLSSDTLKKRFGPLELVLIAQDSKRLTRTSKIVADGRVVACSFVSFMEKGIKAFGPHHDVVWNGAMLGKTVRESGVAFEREEGQFIRCAANAALQFLFGLATATVVGRELCYTICGKPYCLVSEMYSPEVMPPSETLGEIEVVPWAPFLIGRIDMWEPPDVRAYQRLAHGFLRQARHVGIEDEDEFVEATNSTAMEVLVHEDTRVFIAAGDEGFIGYVTINVHPALHVNGIACTITELYVKGPHRRTGVATALVQYAERYAQRIGAQRVALATDWSNAMQHGFYERLGYARTCDFVTKKI